jgi:hypothetical protein
VGREQVYGAASGRLTLVMEVSVLLALALVALA